MKKYHLSSIVIVLLWGIFSQNLSAQNTIKEAVVRVEGEVLKPLTLTISDLAKMKHVDAVMKNREGILQQYSGVPIFDLLQQAGVTVGKELKGENLTKYMLVRSSDGYEMIFSLAELDPGFTNRVVILADSKDGKPLADGAGPFRLVVPDENKPARSALEVTHFIIRFAKD
ncbi:DMSO/TMAO reductase YedYZ molybdopterin-dependent catalytic subunit [Flavobacterium sp. HSC-32F16]|uniref:molybdopterin-dependent oxidoreductase n=1 Tax=Flavobacterium sp. HSC-32F16 TaxID=2910964 RepID=UPI0020A2D0CC|nr:molybdopterin-dependent oxidoreductase [Flavobacterium sp. HSC-32F16]MCP2025246.1 DMSO/TMAO reductase YedYZ molybdopterin-dependent catalytic subunit [Flavobacterium sp. HSC-32F16]